MPIFLNPIYSRESKRFLRFAVVGLSGTFLDFFLLSLLKAFGLPTLPANTFSYSAGTINNFVWNRRWTFREARGDLWKKQMAPFILVSLVGLLLNNTLMQILEARLTAFIGNWGFFIAKVLATGVVIFWNYLANRFWTFKKYLLVNEQRNDITPSVSGYTSEGQGGKLMSAMVYPDPGSDPRGGWLVRPIIWKITPAIGFLGIVVLFSLGLHLYNIQATGDSNNYYTAAAKSMLQSWHNFFFLSAEPGGSVSVDKTPLGFWIEAAFAAVLGINGFALALPNILAGILSIPLLYHLVNKYFGVGAGLTAALVLATTPVTLAVDRNNTIDGMLVFTLLLAAWTFLNATETGKLRYLLLGSFLVALSFNIKMLQAFLPLPAFYALYFFGAKLSWKRKILNLALATVLLGTMSLSWAIIVDRVPASRRPYIGGTSSNSEMELIFGYNGVKRIFGKMPGFRSRVINSLKGGALPLSGLAQNKPEANNAPESAMTDPNSTINNEGAASQTGVLGGTENTGQPGVFRFFRAPLAKEMSWLLPIAIVAMILAAISGRVRFPVISNEHKGLLLWGGWLITCLVFFSIAAFIHNYYLAVLSPPLGALVGMGVWEIAKLNDRSHFLSAAVLLVVAGATLAYEYVLVRQFGLNGIWIGPALALLVIAASINLVRRRSQKVLFHLANIAALSAVLIVPALWSVWTVVYAKNTSQPEAYTGNLPIDPQSMKEYSGGGSVIDNGSASSHVNQSNTDKFMLAYLMKNTKGMKYLVAVPSSITGAPLVILTGRPVLYLGGFSGYDPVINTTRLSKLAANGQLRYIILGSSDSRGLRQDVITWVQSSCQIIKKYSQSAGDNFGAIGVTGPVLYQCGK